MSTANGYIREKIGFIEGALDDMKQRVNDSEKINVYVAEVNSDNTNAYVNDLEFIQRQVTLLLERLKGDEDHKDVVHDLVQDINEKTEKSLLKR